MSPITRSTSVTLRTPVAKAKRAPDAAPATIPSKRRRLHSAAQDVLASAPLARTRAAPTGTPPPLSLPRAETSVRPLNETCSACLASALRNKSDGVYVNTGRPRAHRCERCTHGHICVPMEGDLVRPAMQFLKLHQEKPQLRNSGRWHSLRGIVVYLRNRHEIERSRRVSPSLSLSSLERPSPTHAPSAGVTSQGDG